MAPTRPSKKHKKRDKVAASPSRAPTGSPNEDAKAISPLLLIKAAEVQIQGGNAADALALAERALGQSAPGSDGALAALNLLGHVSLELGDFDNARSYFLKAVAIDADGSKSEDVGGGPEKFLCLAQLSEEGGADSVKWFGKGASALKLQVQTLEGARKRSEEQEAHLEDLRRKHAMTLCAVAEIYMTDLSWEADAEQQCETLVTEATMAAPDFAESWQTLANVRISQSRIEDAKAALLRSLELWKDLPAEDPSVPDFPSRVSLARLLMEVDMEQEAIEVLERLVGEDDHSVEVWYLGGWGLYVMGEKQKAEKSGPEDEWKASWISSRVWLNQCQTLFAQQDYEDERLGEHSKELLAAISQELGDVHNEEDDDEGGDWEDEGSDDEDEDMDD
ncbi:TPR domain-containing protein [Xylariales sp. AK1849]|nr:TPR domain-containing protein [Xylariales sp. AK1849]